MDWSPIGSMQRLLPLAVVPSLSQLEVSESETYAAAGVMGLFVPLLAITTWLVYRKRRIYNIKARGSKIALMAQNVVLLSFLVCLCITFLHDPNCGWVPFITSLHLGVVGLVLVLRCVVLLFRFRISEKLARYKHASQEKAEREKERDREARAVQQQALYIKSPPSPRAIASGEALMSSSSSSTASPPQSGSSAGTTTSSPPITSPATNPPHNAAFPLSDNSGNATPSTVPSSPATKPKRLSLLRHNENNYSESSLSPPLTPRLTTTTTTIVSSASTSATSSASALAIPPSPRSRPDSLTQDTIPDNESLTKGEGGFFIRNRYVILSPFMTRLSLFWSFVLVAVPIALWILPSSSCEALLRRQGPWLIFMVALLVVLLVSLTVAMRGDGHDVFGIKSEMRLNALWMALMMGGEVVVLAVYPHALLVVGVLVMYILAVWMTSTVWPLYISRQEWKAKLNEYELVNISSLRELLALDLGYASFLRYAQREFASENVLFYKRLVDFRAKYGVSNVRAIAKREDCLRDAESIMNEFVFEAALSQVNLPSRVYSELTKAWRLERFGQLVKDSPDRVGRMFRLFRIDSPGMVHNDLKEILVDKPAATPNMASSGASQLRRLVVAEAKTSSTSVTPTHAAGGVELAIAKSEYESKDRDVKPEVNAEPKTTYGIVALFDKAFKEVYQLMVDDLLPRYLHSDEFTDLIDDLKKRQQESQSRRPSTRPSRIGIAILDPAAEDVRKSESKNRRGSRRGSNNAPDNVQVQHSSEGGLAAIADGGVGGTNDSPETRRRVVGANDEDRDEEVGVNIVGSPARRDSHAAERGVLIGRGSLDLSALDTQVGLVRSGSKRDLHGLGTGGGSKQDSKQDSMHNSNHHSRQGSSVIFGITINAGVVDGTPGARAGSRRGTMDGAVAARDHSNSNSGGGQSDSRRGTIESPTNHHSPRHGAGGVDNNSTHSSRRGTALDNKGQAGSAPTSPVVGSMSLSRRTTDETSVIGRRPSRDQLSIGTVLDSSSPGTSAALPADSNSNSNSTSAPGGLISSALAWNTGR